VGGLWLIEDIEENISAASWHFADFTSLKITSAGKPHSAL
jgi:hypothetical protein